MSSTHALATVLAAATVAVLAAGCTQRGGTPASNAAATQDTTPPALLTSAEIARMRRVPLDTIPTHIEPIDNIIRGPSARIVVVRAEYLPAAWTIVGARGTPPVIDFNRDAVILIGTAIHGGTWSVTTDSLYAAGNHLFVLVHEHTDCALIDISARGTIVLRVPVALARHVTFIERPEDTCGGHEAL